MNPIGKPVVNTKIGELNGLQRAAECFRYTILCVEHWISPEGSIRVWVRGNLLLGAWLIIPAIFVMPFVGFILWQVNGWLRCSRASSVGSSSYLCSSYWLTPPSGSSRRSSNADPFSIIVLGFIPDTVMKTFGPTQG